MSAPRKARAERDAWMQADGVVQAALDRMRQLDQERAELVEKLSTQRRERNRLEGIYLLAVDGLSVEAVDIDINNLAEDGAVAALCKAKLIIRAKRWPAHWAWSAAGNRIRSLLGLGRVP